MFKNKLSYLSIKKIYVAISCLIAGLIIIAQSWFPQSLALSEVVTKPFQKLSVEDVAKFSAVIERVEQGWERDYERHFKRNFANRNRSATKIAKHLREIKEQAGINPAIIWAIPGDDFVKLMLVTPQRQFVIKKVRSGRKAVLKRQIKALERGISDSKSLAYLPPARLLHRSLLRPLEPYLEAEKIDTLLFCNGSLLRSLPFAALHDGKKFLVEKYNIALIPAVNLTDLEYESDQKQNVLVAGASKFEKLPNLPGIEVELNTIVPQIWSGRKLLNQDFTVDNFKKAHQSGTFDVIHIASHSQFNPGSPEESFIQFSDRKISLANVDDLELNFPEVDLLVLSSCQTAVGNKEAEFGFAGLAMQAGVKSALASLWNVDDTGTIVLMSEFYQKLRSTPIKAQALRQAQMAILNQDVSIGDQQIRGSELEIPLPSRISEGSDRNLQHPFYWSGFTMIGNPW